MGGTYIKNFIEKIIGDVQLISLCDFENYGGYSPFHIMNNGGFLGSHLDHSRSKNNDLHVANSIFYVSPKWESNSGGETILFNKNGFKIKKFISPVPNRLIIFLHTAESFHGVNTISPLVDSSVRRAEFAYFGLKQVPLLRPTNPLQISHRPGPPQRPCPRRIGIWRRRPS